MDPRIVTAAALMLALAACSRPAERAEETPASAAPPEPVMVTAPAGATSAATTVFACANGETARAAYPDTETAIVEYQGRTHTLKAVPAASGARYIGEGLQWWTQGADKAAVAPLGVGETMAKGGVITCTRQGVGASAEVAATQTPTPEPTPSAPATREVPK
jgi:membrane-bound inhibitor of C-type lysozyme